MSHDDASETAGADAPVRTPAGNTPAHVSIDPRPPLTPAARRALAEAEERRKAAAAAEAEKPQPKELGGRNGPDPVRFGDWEKGGIISDF